MSIFKGWGFSFWHPFSKKKYSVSSPVYLLPIFSFYHDSDEFYNEPGKGKNKWKSIVKHKMYVFMFTIFGFTIEISKSVIDDTPSMKLEAYSVDVDSNQEIRTYGVFGIKFGRNIIIKLDKKDTPYLESVYRSITFFVDLPLIKGSFPVKLYKIKAIEQDSKFLN